MRSKGSEVFWTEPQETASSGHRGSSGTHDERDGSGCFPLLVGALIFLALTMGQLIAANAAPDCTCMGVGPGPGVFLGLVFTVEGILAIVAVALWLRFHQTGRSRAILGLVLLGLVAGPSALNFRPGRDYSDPEIVGVVVSIGEASDGFEGVRLADGTELTIETDVSHEASNADAFERRSDGGYPLVGDLVLAGRASGAWYVVASDVAADPRYDGYCEQRFDAEPCYGFKAAGEVTTNGVDLDIGIRLRFSPGHEHSREPGHLCRQDVYLDALGRVLGFEPPLCY